jgi:hypothetical protein
MIDLLLDGYVSYDIYLSTAYIRDQDQNKRCLDLIGISRGTCRDALRRLASQVIELKAFSHADAVLTSKLIIA